MPRSNIYLNNLVSHTQLKSHCIIQPFLSLLFAILTFQESVLFRCFTYIPVDAIVSGCATFRVTSQPVSERTVFAAI